MATQAGFTRFDASVPAATPLTTIGTFTLDLNISYSFDLIIENGATPPTTPLLFTWEYRRSSGGPVVSQSISGPTGANDKLIIPDIAIPYNAYDVAYKYTGADTEAVNLTVLEGRFKP